MIYNSRPPSGSVGRLAWDLYVHKHKRAPESVEYSPNYNYQDKGWICEHVVSSVFVKHMNYGGSSNYVFYSSAYLAGKKDEIRSIKYVEPDAVVPINDDNGPSLDEIAHRNNLMSDFIDKVKVLFEKGVKLHDARSQVLTELGFNSIDEYLIGNNCNVVVSNQPRDPSSYFYRNK